MPSSKKETALENRSTQGERLFSPSAARNRCSIREVFLRYLPAAGSVLEVGSGTGEHAIHMASASDGLTWLASDPDAAARASIAAHIAASGLSNVEGPRAIDVCEKGWTAGLGGPFDAIVSINMIHIAPFAAAEGLFDGAARLLGSGGRLILYGPYSRGGVHSAPSNEAFDASLKARDPRWGVRDLEHDIAPLAQKYALQRDAIVQMPANNLTVIFAKQ